MKIIFIYKFFLLLSQAFSDLRHIQKEKIYKMFYEYFTLSINFDLILHRNFDGFQS